MAEFRTTKGIIASLEEIIRKAERKLVLISPFFQVSEDFYSRLTRCCDKGIEVIIVYGKDRLNHQEWNKIASLNNVELRYYENLHAKCYYNESQLLLGSMNFFEYSERNIEMGVLIDVAKDNLLYEDAVSEAETLISRSNIKRASSLKSSPKKVLSINRDNGGFCIRCGTDIQWNIDKPLCSECYKSWSRWEDVEYPENGCHTCGRHPAKVSVLKPQCTGCYNKNGLIPDIY